MNMAELPTGRAIAAVMRSARCRRHEFILASFATDIDALARLLPRPLRPDRSPLATLTFIAASAIDGSTDLSARLTVDARLYGAPVQFVLRSYAEQPPADASSFDTDAGYGRVRWVMVHETMTAIVEHGGRPLAIAGLGARSALALDTTDAYVTRLLQPQLHLRRLPGVPGRPALTQLIARTYSDFSRPQFRGGAAQVELAGISSALPVRQTLPGVHLVAELALSPAQVVHDDRLRDSSALLRSLTTEAFA
jgi:acetoacetate decarboxylase